MKPRYVPPGRHNVHLHKLIEHFGEVAPQAASLPSDVSYIFLCFTNRCGSNYVAELLASSGDYNCAGENLNWDTVVAHSKRLDLNSFQDYFAWLVSKQKKSGHFFVKADVSQIELLGHAGILEQVEDRSKFLMIERGDKLGQAISYALSFATQRFTSLMAGKKAPEEVEFSRQRIDSILAGIVECYKHFNLYFARNGIVPIHLIYEHLLADQDVSARLLGTQLELPDFRFAPEKIRLERQAGPVNAAWREQYLSEPFA